MARNARRNWYLGWHAPLKASAFVEGCTHPASWLLPLIAGGMASRYNAVMSFDGSGSAAAGVNIEGSASFLIDFAAAAGQLIVSGAGTASMTFTLTGNALATLNGEGSASFAITSTGTASALAWAQGTTTMSFSGSLVSYAIGNMTGTTEEAGLTPSGIATAVWAKVIEAGYSAEQIVRLLAAHAAGAATGLEGANPQFTGLDGSTLRIDGTYSAGTRTIDALNAD